MLRINKIIFFVLIVFTASCATTTKLNIRPLKSDKPLPGNMGAILLNYSLLKQAESLPDVCEVIFQEKWDNNKYYFELEPNKNSILVEIPPGVYRFKQLYCDLKKDWTFEEGNNLPEFEVMQGKTSYIGFMIFSSSSQKHLSAYFEKILNTQKVLQGTLRKLSNDFIQNLISAYTLKSIQFSMLNKRSDIFKFYYEYKLDNQKKPYISIPKYEPCWLTEIKKNPLYFGALNYKVQYENGDFVDMKKVEDNHTLTLEFTECIEKVFTEFKPEFKGSLTLKAVLD